MTELLPPTSSSRLARALVHANEAKTKAQTLHSLFVYPTVDDGVNSLIARFGAAEVKAALKRVPSRKGNLPIKTDQPKLLKVYLEDSLKLLARDDPFISRSNHSIATEIAAEEPTHKRPSIYRRILRKLKSDRKFFTYFCALLEAEKKHPHDIYRKAIAATMRASRSLQNESDRKSWKKSLQSSTHFLNQAISSYERLYGLPPESKFSYQQIKELNLSWKPKLANTPMRLGSLGLGNSSR